MFLGAVLIAYWVMRATGYLGPLGSPDGLIRGPGRGDSRAVAGSPGTGSRVPGSAGGGGSRGDSRAVPGYPGTGSRVPHPGSRAPRYGDGWSPGSRVTWSPGSGPRARARRAARGAGAAAHRARGIAGTVADWCVDRWDDGRDLVDEAVREARRRRAVEERQRQWDERAVDPAADHRSRIQRRRDRAATCTECGHRPDSLIEARRACPCTACACQEAIPEAAPKEPPSDRPPAGPYGADDDDIVDAEIVEDDVKGSDGAAQPTELPAAPTPPALPAGTTEGDPMSTTIDVDQAKIRDVYSAFDSMKDILRTLGEGLSAKDMDPDSLADLAELEEVIDAKAAAIHQRHDLMQQAHDETAHPADKSAYVSD